MSYAAQRQAINDLLPRLSEAELKGLHRIHDNAPWKGLDNCPDHKLADTLALIHRTLDG